MSYVGAAESCLTKQCCLAAQVAAGDKAAPASGGAAATSVASLVAELEAAVAGEDPYSGEIVVRNIERPFIDASEADEVASWQL